MFIKGAPDYLIKKSTHVKTKSGKVVPFDKQAQETFMSNIVKLADKGLRTL
jgi:magnesium-transporting ATPase (P-type)